MLLPFQCVGVISRHEMRKLTLSTAFARFPGTGFITRPQYVCPVTFFYDAIIETFLITIILR